MGLIGSLLAAVVAFSLATMERLGYVGLFLLMVGESMILPIPSEAVLPFAGFLAATGVMSLAVVLVVAALASLVGSLLSYYLGAALTPLVERYGKYFFVMPHHLHAAHRFIEKRGAPAVFFSRFVPGWRHVVSIPAGTVRMPIVPFAIATTAGAFIWNSFLVLAGFYLAENWREIEKYTHELEIAILAAIVLTVAGGVAYWLYRRRSGAKEVPAPQREPTLRR